MKIKLLVIGENDPDNIALMEAIRFREDIEVSFLLDGYCLYFESKTKALIALCKAERMLQDEKFNKAGSQDNVIKLDKSEFELKLNKSFSFIVPNKE